MLYLEHKLIEKWEHELLQILKMTIEQHFASVPDIMLHTSYIN